MQRYVAFVIYSQTFTITIVDTWKQQPRQNCKNGHQKIRYSLKNNEKGSLTNLFDH